MTVPGALRSVAALLVGGLAATSAALAQCPDGSPPPCRTASSAAAPVRRPNPPLDDRTWVVLPFENIARVADIDWLQDASVNLLYLDMSKWRDIHVIDDERVADLIREVPEARAQITLQSGIAVARRAGAGKLVMGDLLKVGSRTRVVAKVYDVRSGQRIRNVVQESNHPDSLVAMFGRLARAILNADPPAGTSLGTVGTGSLEAYRAYVSGVTALSRVDLDSAEVAFNRAIALDSSFALAHYKISVVYGWINAGDPRRVQHALTANRLSASLPQRERQLILGQYQTTQSHWGEACLTYGALVLADSNDVEAWYNLGECSYHNTRVDFVDGDSTRAVFHGSWNTAMRAFQRALELDPTYHLAYSHIPDILLTETRTGCYGQDVMDSCSPNSVYLARLLRAGDSLVTAPVPAIDQSGIARQAADALRQGVWRTNMLQNRVSAQAWVNSGPDEPRAHLALARAMLRAGQPQDAAREFAQGHNAQLGTAELTRAVLDRFELLFKLDSMSALARMVDSVSAHANPSATTLSFAQFSAVLLGRWGRIQGIFAAGNQTPQPVRRYLVATMQTLQGAPPADLVAIELGLDSLFEQQTGSARRAVRSQFLLGTMPWTLTLARPASLRDNDTSSIEPRVRMVYQLVHGDTAAARRTLARLDSSALAAPRELPNAIDLQWSAEGHLALGDSVTALARLREVEARLPYLNPMSAYLTQFGNLTVSVQTWPRTFMRLADLAATQGDGQTAARNYHRIIDLWSGADASFQPLVQHAREALARVEH